VSDPARAGSCLAGLGLPAADDHSLTPSPQRFDDGGQCRIEIPSVEGPAAMRVALEEAEELGVPLHRVSQGSGIWMLTDAELREMVALGEEHDVEVVLFTGPRASWGYGRQAATPAGAVVVGSLRGADELAAGIEEVLRGVALGLRGVLVSDLGLLMVLGRLKAKGDLPEDLQLKVSISLPVANPATARMLADVGATSLNLPADLPLASIAAIRQSVDIPIDVYVESADEFGGAMRYYELPQLVSVGAPVYLKFTVRNAPSTYPSGRHLQGAVEALTAERVRRASLGLQLLLRHAPHTEVSPVRARVSRP
jgi:hypothetical protein